MSINSRVSRIIDTVSSAGQKDTSSSSSPMFLISIFRANALSNTQCILDITYINARNFYDAD